MGLVKYSHPYRNILIQIIILKQYNTRHTAKKNNQKQRVNETNESR